MFVYMFGVLESLPLVPMGVLVFSMVPAVFVPMGLFPARVLVLVAVKVIVLMVVSMFMGVGMLRIAVRMLVSVRMGVVVFVFMCMLVVAFHFNSSLVCKFVNPEVEHRRADMARSSLQPLITGVYHQVRTYGARRQ